MNMSEDEGEWELGSDDVGCGNQGDHIGKIVFLHFALLVEFVKRWDVLTFLLSLYLVLGRSWEFDLLHCIYFYLLEYILHCLTFSPRAHTLSLHFSRWFEFPTSHYCPHDDSSSLSLSTCIFKPTKTARLCIVSLASEIPSDDSKFITTSFRGSISFSLAPKPLDIPDTCSFNRSNHQTLSSIPKRNSTNRCIWSKDTHTLCVVLFARSGIVYYERAWLILTFSWQSASHWILAESKRGGRTVVLRSWAPQLPRLCDHPLVLSVLLNW